MLKDDELSLVRFAQGADLGDWLCSPGFTGFRLRLSWRRELYTSDAQLSAAYRDLMGPTSVMTNHSGDVPSVSEICARVNERVESVMVERPDTPRDPRRPLRD